jgi:hypothetical protein
VIKELNQAHQSTTRKYFFENELHQLTARNTFKMNKNSSKKSYMSNPPTQIYDDLQAKNQAPQLPVGKESEAD